MQVKFWYKNLAVLYDGSGILKEFYKDEIYLYHYLKEDVLTILNTRFDEVHFAGGDEFEYWIKNDLMSIRLKHGIIKKDLIS